MDDDRRQLEYASCPKPDPKRKDLVRLALIGTVFGVAFLVFLFWRTLSR